VHVESLEMLDFVAAWREICKSDLSDPQYTSVFRLYEGAQRFGILHAGRVVGIFALCPAPDLLVLQYAAEPDVLVEGLGGLDDVAELMGVAFRRDVRGGWLAIRCWMVLGRTVARHAPSDVVFWSIHPRLCALYRDIGSELVSRQVLHTLSSGPTEGSVFRVRRRQLVPGVVRASALRLTRSLVGGVVGRLRRLFR